MSHPIPPDAQRLADRLRMLAEEIESAARYGIPIPFCVTVAGHEYADASFAATPEEFDAWVDYAGATTERYRHKGLPWLRAKADVNGLPLSFAVQCAPTLIGVPADVVSA